MSEQAQGTKGGASGTDGELRRRRHWLVLGAALFMGVQAVANVESTMTDLARHGAAASRVHVWAWQLSSLATWIALMPAIWWLVRHVRPPRLNWPLAALAHAAATVPVSVAHVLGMIAIRQLVYAAMGEAYRFGTLGERLAYEYPKDAASYILIAAFLAFAQWLLARPAPAAEPAPDSGVLLVVDGSVTHRVPVDAIDWAASAGNYVELAWEGRTLLHRSTLAALADRLGTGFVRIHRGRLVRRAAVQRVETDKSGDFTVTLASGAELRGSRRYRAGL